MEDRTLFAVGALSAAAFPAGPDPASATANGQSEVAPAHSVSDDGRYIVFVSTADNVVPGQVDTQPVQDVFLHDRVTNTTKLVSHTLTSLTTTANGPSVNAVISGDGSTVVFYSFATDLVAGQTFSGTGRSALYLYDVPSGNLQLVSHTPASIAPEGSVTQVASATYPAVPSTPGGAFPFVNSLAYSTPGGGLALPSVSHDGQYIAYISNARDLVGANAGNGIKTNAFLYDRAADTNTLISHNATSLTTAANGWASTVAISADGSTVAFTNPATNLIAGLTVRNNGSDELYVWSRIDNPNTGMAAGELRLASHSASSPTEMATIPGSFLFGFTADAPPSLSASGNFIAYYFAGSNLVAGQGGTPSVLNVFRYTVSTNTNELVTHIAGDNAIAGDNPPNQIAPFGVGPSEATGPAISADGRFIAFANNSSNLLATPLVGQDGQDNVYLYDATTQENTLVSHADGSLTTANPNGGTAPSISADGRYVAFIDLAYPAADPYTWGNTTATAYVRIFDRLAADPTAQPAVVGGAIDLDTSKIIASAILAPTVMSADGQTVVWNGNASTVVANDLNGNLDVFLWVPDGTVTLPIIDLLLSGNETTAGQPVNTFIGTLTTIDPNPGQTHTYTLLTGTDWFTISGDALLTNTTFLNTTLETYEVTIRTTDAPLGLTLDRTFTITVNPSTTVPIDITLSSSTTTAGSPVGTAVGTLSTDDPNVGVTHTYTMLPGPSSDLFTIIGDTLQTNTVFENTTAESYDLQIQTTNTLGLSFIETVTITVNPAVPIDITLSNSTLTAAQPVGTEVGVLATEGSNPGETFSYTLSGPDADLFAVDSDGVLRTNIVFAVGAPTTYTLVVLSSNERASAERTFIITINPALPTGVTLSNSTATAGQPAGTMVGVLATEDPNPDQTFSYTLSGPDADLFAVDSDGVLRTNTDFSGLETVTFFTVVVRSEDSLGLWIEETFTITVSPVIVIDT